jgi:hypothetical protein
VWQAPVGRAVTAVMPVPSVTAVTAAPEVTALQD